MEQSRIRVAAYVIRCRTVPELLVFDHVGMPEAGTQIPAGGVHPGEDLEQAVLREVAEETGLFDISVINRIAVDHRPHPQTRHPRRTTFFRLDAREDTPDAWTHRVDGTGADQGMKFACRFVVLPLEKPLADQQDAWLDQIST
ncbi:NUDIX domain-containing protein [Nocardia uniformis]|uniref:NUDIX domain-containing protein n=1 Tax=Nocardia uniformis TaxID=53432 RepID=A0A849C5U8_9NOCA|nr:NUDIX domain-containing protein [Nocardia uniformis]NNH71790.1 NUDIX domain-containing protein [Nocardia uniformis]